MASSYSTNTGIELIATGEQSGTWGDTTNVNLQIIDRLTKGVGAITLTGTTHALTTTDGTLSDGQYAVLVFGGTPSGTNTVTISPNNQQKLFFVKNNSGQSIVFTQGSGGNVTIANGNSAVIYADGAGVGATVVDLTATFPAAGALVAANNLSDLVSAATALVNLGLTATAVELNNLDGFTGTVADLNYAKDLRATGVTTTEFDKLDGLTATTAQLNILDGATLTTEELNILDGATVTTAELNILDGATVTTAELNYSDIATLGLSQASKVVTADANGNVRMQEELQVTAYIETVVGLAGTSVTVDCDEANSFTLTTSGNTTFTFSYAGINLTTNDAYGFTLRVTAGGGHTLSWPASVDWAGATAPDAPASGETDVFVFYTTTGGSTWYGFQAGDAMA